jgi:hypothetical protein
VAVDPPSFARGFLAVYGAPNDPDVD